MSEQPIGTSADETGEERDTGVEGQPAGDDFIGEEVGFRHGSNTFEGENGERGDSDERTTP